jgi:hypothetical protein
MHITQVVGILETLAAQLQAGELAVAMIGLEGHIESARRQEADYEAYIEAQMDAVEFLTDEAAWTVADSYRKAPLANGSDFPALTSMGAPSHADTHFGIGGHQTWFPPNR